MKASGPSMGGPQLQVAMGSIATTETSDYRTCVWAPKQLDRDFDEKPFFMTTHRCIRYSDGTEEFFDHETDPMERKKLVEDETRWPVVDVLRSHLPIHSEPEAVHNEIDKKRFPKAMAEIKQMGPEYRRQAERGLGLWIRN